MNWNTVVQHLGWNDLVAKWEHPEVSSSHAADSGSQLAECQADYSKIRSLSSTIHSHVDAFVEPENTSKKSQTNPFLNEDEDDYLDLVDPVAEHATNDEIYYLDSHGNQHGPFREAEMAAWYDSGYFHGAIRVRKAVEPGYVTIDDLTAKQSKEIFSTFSLSDRHVPPEYVARVASIINPFCHVNQAAKSTLSTCDKHKESMKYVPEKYSINICQGMKKLTLKSTDAECEEQIMGRTPLKFALSAAKGKNQTLDQAQKSSPVKPTQSNKDLTAKMDKLQKFWQDVAMSKLIDPKHARHLQLKLLGRSFDAVLAPEARVSCLGAGAVNFLKCNMQPFTKYKSGSRTIKSEDGTNAVIAGHVNISVAFRNITVPNFKMLVVPDLEYFLYVGSDFQKKFIHKKVVLPPGVNFSRTEREPCKFSREFNPSKYSILREIEELFPDLQEEGLGLTNLEVHNIEVDISWSAEPFQSPVVLAKEDPLAVKILSEMIACDIIEESVSPWKLAVLPVCDSKQETLCLDMRRINAATQPVFYAFPSKNKMLKRLKESIYISSIELSFVEWQIPLHCESRKYTSFEINGHSYQFKRMSPGMKNARTRIRRLMDKIVTPDPYALVSTTLVLFSRDFEAHTKQLGKVARKLDESGVKANIPQSCLCSKAIKCYGFIVGSDSQEPDPDAWKCILSIACPKTKQRLRTFLQMVEWYRELIPSYDQVVAPLLLLSKSKSENLRYPPEASEAFGHVKRLLIREIAMSGPDFELPFYVQCNVNFEMIAGLLYQVDSAGTQRPVAYYVKDLSKSQQQFAVTELECLAVVMCLKAFQPYIEDEKFVVVTDKFILSWILAEDQLPLRLLRWCMALQVFHFTIQQRQPALSSTRSVFNKVDSALVIEIQNMLRKTQGSACPACELLGQKIKTFPHEHLDHKVHEDLVYCRREFNCGNALIDERVWKLFVSESVAGLLAQRVHIDPFGHHRSRQQMETYLASEFYWPDMSSDVQKVVRTCDKCRKL